MMRDTLIAAIRPFWFRGKGRLLDWLVRDEKDMLEALVFGSRFRLDLSDLIQRHIYLGTFEPRETSLVRRYLRPGMTFVDVGANVGYFTALAASCVGPQGKVFSVEPSPYASQLLQEMATRNGLGQVRVNRFGLGSQAGRINLYVPPEGSGNHTPSAVPNGGGKPVEIEIKTLDDCFAYWGVDRADLLKIDIEGFELNALRGARKILSEGRIAAILCEFNEPWLRKAGGSADELYSLITGAGYRCVHGRLPSRPDGVANLFFTLGGR